MKQVDIMRCYSGSLAYGTNLPTSDVDIRGIFCAAPECIRTPFFPINEQVLTNEEDGKIYELTNFFKLFTDMNPNIIELMFVDESDIISTSLVYEYLRSESRGLLSKKVAFTFSGYAMSQLKRIKGHDKWINNPQPEILPTQKEFLKLVQNWEDSEHINQGNFQECLNVINKRCVLIPYGNNLYGVMRVHEEEMVPGMFTDNGSIRNIEYESIPDEMKKRQPEVLVKYLAEEHRLAKEKHHNYWTWKKNRNEIRHETEVKFGFDTKHGMHLVRLMRMAEEILITGEVLVKRPDAQELLDIRNGKWTLNELLEWAEGKDELIRGKLYKESPLPKSVDIHKASKILMTAQDMCWSQM